MSQSAEQIETQLRGLLRGKFANLTVTFNEHKSCYLDVKTAIEIDMIYERAEWVSEEEKARAIETDSVWVIQWYPHTAGGFEAVAASSFAVCLQAAISLQAENDASNNKQG